MGDLVTEGERLVSAFLYAQEGLERAKSGVNGAECDLANAERELAKWLMPADMAPGEKIAVWRGDSLFQVELAPIKSHAVGGQEHVRHEPKVTVRMRGKDFHRLRLAG